MFWQLLNRGTYMQILSKFKNPLYANIFILGLSGIIAKLFDFSFRAFYSRALGAGESELSSLGFSLHGVMLTIATAGLGIAVSKTASVYTERGNPAAVRQCVRMAIVGVSVPALLVMLITFIFAPRIAAVILGDIRIAPSLCTLVPSIIFMGISYCTKGCFYAIRKTLPPASSEILEQAVKFVSIWGLLKIFLPYGVPYGCGAVFGGIDNRRIFVLFISFDLVQKGGTLGFRSGLRRLYRSAQERNSDKALMRFRTVYDNIALRKPFEDAGRNTFDFRL